MWVNIPKTGYVGVGAVIGERCRADGYCFETEQSSRTLLEIASPEEDWHLYRHIEDEDEDEDEAEFLVPVCCLHTLSRKEASSEVGMFGNRNIDCKPTTPKWSHTGHI